MSMKIPVTLSGIKPAAFSPVMQCLNQMCHRQPRTSSSVVVIVAVVVVIVVVKNEMHSHD